MATAATLPKDQEPSPLTEDQANALIAFIKAHCWYAILVVLVVLVMLAGITFLAWKLATPSPAVLPAVAEQKVTKTKLTGAVGQVVDLRAPRQATFVWDVPAQRQLQVRVAGENCYLYPGEPGTFYAGYSFLEDFQVHLVQFEVEVSGPILPAAVPPAVAAAPLWLVVVDAGKGGAAGKFFTDSKLVDRVVSKGHRWRIVDREALDDKGAEQEDLVHVVDKVKDKKLPRVVVADRAGKVHFEAELTAIEPATLLAEIVKAGG